MMESQLETHTLQLQELTKVIEQLKFDTGEEIEVSQNQLLLCVEYCRKDDFFLTSSRESSRVVHSAKQNR